MTHSEIPEPPPSASSTPSTSEVADTEAEIIREILAVSAVVKRYLAAVTAMNETDETRFTCGRKHPSLLWISAAGRPITLVAVTSISIEPAEAAIMKIQVEGEAASELTLKKVDGAWCVWP